jgi:hypothetical protein
LHGFPDGWRPGALRIDLFGDLAADVAQLGYLVGPDCVEYVSADRFDMAGRGLLDHGPPGVGECRLDKAGVLGGGLAEDPAALLQALDDV